MILQTRSGPLRFPTYIPVTTFGQKYPLDQLIRPYLPRLSDAVMVSYHYAQQMKPHERPPLPLMVDSGGFASLFDRVSIKEQHGMGIIRFEDGSQLTPQEVLQFQEVHADVAFTLDFIILPKHSQREKKKRFDLTIKNALWALQNRRRKDLILYASLQAHDVKSAQKAARVYASAGFDGIAIGGLVPRRADWAHVESIITTVKQEALHLPLHVFGLGHPETVQKLYALGVQSVDSSSYVKLAADGKTWADPEVHLKDASPLERLELAMYNLVSATGKPLPLSAVTKYRKSGF